MSELYVIPSSLLKHIGLDSIRPDPFHPTSLRKLTVLTGLQIQAAMESCAGKLVMSGVMGFGMGGLFGMFMASVCSLLELSHISFPLLPLLYQRNPFIFRIFSLPISCFLLKPG